MRRYLFRCPVVACRCFFAVAFATVIGVSPMVAQAQTVREGFTLDVSAGAGLNRANGETDFAVQGLSVGIGGFVTNDLALTLRWALSGGFEDVTIREPDGDLEKTTLAFGPQFLGPTAQLWLNDHLFVSAGVGLGVYGVHPLLDLIDRNSDLDISVDTRYGIGASLRSAFTVWQRENAAVLFIGAEALPIFLDDDVVVGGGLVAGFQVL
ncbi:MAG: hypothetical protein AAFP04_04150 [Myxococcota bacterium]